MDINELRQKINAIDDVLSDAFKKRMEVALEIARYKQENGLPVYDPRREQAVLERLTADCDDVMAAFMRDLYGKLFAQCPGLKGIIFVGESCEFPSKDPHVLHTTRYLNNNKPSIGDKCYPGWYPCCD